MVSTRSRRLKEVKEVPRASSPFIFIKNQKPQARLQTKATAVKNDF